MKMRAGVAAGHPSTAQAGADILSRGGSAVDAAVAMMLVSCAAETIFTGLGGGGFATVYDATNTQVRCLDFFVGVPGLGGKRPSPATSIEVIFIGQHVPYEIGPATVAVPGVPAGAHYLWQRWGRLPWAAVTTPGREASYGTPFPAMHAQVLPRVAAAMCVGEGVEVYQRLDGSYLQAGDPLRHPDHHRAYELMLRDPRAFYHGAYADALVIAVSNGGALTQEDLDAYHVIESKPRSVRVNDFTVHARGNDLDDLLGTIERVAPAVHGDPTTDAHSAAASLRARGVKTVAITMGSRGAILAGDAGAVHIPAVKVEAVDTTGAGDAFTAALAVSLAEGLPLKDAAHRASVAAALSITRIGTQSAFPSLSEVTEWMQRS